MVCKAFVKNIASMGFPQARVSRAVQRLGKKDSEVMCSSTFSLAMVLPLFFTMYTRPGE